MPRRFPLYAKILLLFALNVALLGLGVFFVARAQFGFGRDWPLTAAANGRVDAACGWIISEMETEPASKWDGALESLSEAYHHRVHFLVFGGNRQLAGPQVELPPEVAHRIEEHGRGHPHDGPPPEPPARAAGGGPGSAGPMGPPPFPFREPRPLMKAGNPPRYWVVAPMMFRGGDRPQPVRVVVMSETLSGGGLLFDARPWVIMGAVSLILTALLWLPLALGINRSLSQMTRATEQIAEGRFEARVEEGRRDELGALGHAINQMAARLSGLVGGQKRFLGDVAHELCSPLAKLRVALGILEQRAGLEEKAYASQADEEAGRMAELVNELLAFSKTSLGASQVKLGPVDLRGAAEEAVRREQKDTKIAIEIEPGLKARGEMQLLTRALANLVRNAISYAGEAGPITVGARREGLGIAVWVADNGPGAPEGELAKIFDPFYRLDRSRDRETGGVGLGLAIVKTCVEACGGTVSCRNRAPHGLEVVMRLAAE